MKKMKERTALKEFFNEFHKRKAIRVLPNRRCYSAKLEKVLDLATVPGLINLDVKDFYTAFAEAGTLTLFSIQARGRKCTEKACRELLKALRKAKIADYDGATFNVSGGNNLTLYDVNELAEVIYNFLDPDANIIFGAVIDENKDDWVEVTVVAGSNLNTLR